jgi:hypothetical protein
MQTKLKQRKPQKGPRKHKVLQKTLCFFVLLGGYFFGLFFVFRRLRPSEMR